jgi:hypothetical protein
MHPVHDVDAFEQDVEGQAKVRQVIHTKEKELSMLRESDAIASRDSQLVLSEVKYDALVLDARLRQSLVTVRSLGSRGLRVSALETFDRLPAPAFASRWCQHKVVCPASEGTKDYLTYLEQILVSTMPQVLITSFDGTIALLRQHREQRRVVSQLVTTPEEARSAVEELTCFGGIALFQQFLSGRRESLSFFYARGKIYARFAFWGKRTNPPLGGIYVLRQAITLPPDTGQQAERLVREIELEGYSQVEFRRDSAGKPYLMEINPRFNLGIEVAVRAGVDFPYLLYQWASGDRIDAVKSYKIGGQMRSLGGDIETTIAAVRQRGRPGVTPPARAVLDFFLSFFVPMRYDYLDWSDPLPVWTAINGFARSMFRQIGRSLSPRKAQ